MTALCFVDSNLLVYRRDAGEAKKQPVAERWVRRLWETRAGRLSVQVLEEFYQVVTRRLKPGLPVAEARREIRDYLVWKPVALTPAVVEHAWEVEDRFALSWWDSLIVSAAQLGGCAYLLTEDLQDGMDMDGLRVVDPFRHDPQSILG